MTIEAGSNTTPFYLRLADALSLWVEGHPYPDGPLEFIGPRGIFSKTPRQIAQEVRDQTPFGQQQTQFYLAISTNMGDPTGERVIKDLMTF